MTVWTLEIENADRVVSNIYNLADSTGLIVYAGASWEQALRVWHKSEAPWLELKLGDISVFCANLPVTL